VLSGTDPAARWVLHAVRADQLIALPQRQPVAVLHQKAARTGELVGLLRYHPYGEFLAGQIGVGQHKRVGGVLVVGVEQRRIGIGTPTRRQLVQRLVGGIVGLLGARSVVVSGIGSLFLSRSVPWQRPGERMQRVGNPVGVGYDRNPLECRMMVDQGTEC
jgi:hypothetical protein